MTFQSNMSILMGSMKCPKKDVWRDMTKRCHRFWPYQISVPDPFPCLAPVFMTISPEDLQKLFLPSGN